MTEWEKFYKLVNSCYSSSAKKELGLSGKEKEIPEKEFIELTKLYLRCFYGKLGYVSDTRFNNLLSEVSKSMEDMMSKSKERGFKYTSKFLDPRVVLEHQELTENINVAVTDEIGDVLESEDTRLITRMLILSFFNNMAYQTVLDILTPLIDIISVANETLGLNQDWANSLLSLGLEEALVKEKLREFGYKPKKKEKFYKLSQELMKKLEETGKRLDLDVLTADGFRNARHLVVHDPVQWNPQEDDANEIARHTITLAGILFPREDDETNK